MQIKNVAILANPKAGNGNAMKVANWLSKELANKNIPNEIFSSSWPSNSLLENFSDCWIIGGDGTINYFINRYPDCKNALALFDSGTGNDFAWKLYADTNLQERFNQS